jgi:predicted aminopeptidase
MGEDILTERNLIVGGVSTGLALGFFAATVISFFVRKPNTYLIFAICCAVFIVWTQRFYMKNNLAEVVARCSGLKRNP